MTNGAPTWEKVLWEELDQQDDIVQIVTCGEWITRMTQNLLTALADRRREKVIQVLARPDMDSTRLAEEIGTRRTTITRLAEEGRARRREELRDASEGAA
jgi:hypothetical protein